MEWPIVHAYNLGWEDRIEDFSFLLLLLSAHLVVVIMMLMV